MMVEVLVRRPSSLLAFVVAAGLGVPATPSAQPAPPRLASAYLPPGHWSVDAARRLEDLGLARSGIDLGAQVLPRHVVAAVFVQASRVAGEEAPAFVPLAQAYLERFTEEFPATVARVRGEEEGRPAEGAAIAAFERHRGRIRPGVGYENGVDWTGPASVEDVAGATAAAEWSVWFVPHLAVSVNPVRRAGDWRVDGVYVVGTWRALGGWVGRRPIGYGRGRGGGIVLNSVTAFDGGGIHLAEPVRLPGFLRALGPFTFEATVARGEESGPVERPWVLATRLAAAPHPRLSIGLTRAAIFGGEDENRISLRNLASLLVGKHAGAGSGFENQIVAIDAWYRPPIDALPLALYLEWGIEDSAGAFVDSPGLLAGLEIAALPSLPTVSLALERTSFSQSCCGNPIWYRHWRFNDGWTHRGVPLGHPLGGHGTEWLVHASATLLHARLRLDVRGVTRERGDENVFAPDRAGRSNGASIGIAYRSSPRLDAILDVATESGAGWSESSLFLGVRVGY